MQLNTGFVFLMAFLGILGFAAPHIIKYSRQTIQAKIQTLEHERLRSLLMLVSEAALAAAGEMMQVFVEGAKAASADGKLTKQEAAYAARKAAGRAWVLLGRTVQAELAREAGSPDQAVARFVEPAIEGAVGRLKGTPN